MIFSCSSCQTRYSLPDDKVANRVLKVRCKTCGVIVVVRDPALGSESGEAGAGAAMEAWYVAIGGQQQGPMTAAAVRALVKAGTVDEGTWVWRPGLDEWAVARDVPETAVWLAALAPPTVQEVAPAPPAAAAPATERLERTAAPAARTAAAEPATSKAAAEPATPKAAAEPVTPKAAAEPAAGAAAGADEDEEEIGGRTVREFWPELAREQAVASMDWASFVEPVMPFEESLDQSRPAAEAAEAAEAAGEPSEAGAEAAEAPEEPSEAGAEAAEAPEEPSEASAEASEAAEEPSEASAEAPEAAEEPSEAGSEAPEAAEEPWEAEPEAAEAPEEPLLGGEPAPRPHVSTIPMGRDLSGAAARVALLREQERALQAGEVGAAEADDDLTAAIAGLSRPEAEEPEEAESPADAEAEVPLETLDDVVLLEEDEGAGPALPPLPDDAEEVSLPPLPGAEAAEPPPVVALPEPEVPGEAPEEALAAAEPEAPEEAEAAEDALAAALAAAEAEAAEEALAAAREAAEDEPLFEDLPAEAAEAAEAGHDPHAHLEDHEFVETDLFSHYEDETGASHGLGGLAADAPVEHAVAPPAPAVTAEDRDFFKKAMKEAPRLDSLTTIKAPTRKERQALREEFSVVALLDAGHRRRTLTVAALLLVLVSVAIFAWTWHKKQQELQRSKLAAEFADNGREIPVAMYNKLYEARRLEQQQKLGRELTQKELDALTVEVEEEARSPERLPRPKAKPAPAEPKPAPKPPARVAALGDGPARIGSGDGLKVVYRDEEAEKAGASDATFRKLSAEDYAKLTAAEGGKAEVKIQVDPGAAARAAEEERQRKLERQASGRSAEVVKIFGRKTRQFTRCKTDVDEKIKAQFTVGANGQVTSVEVTGSRSGQKAQCVSEIIRRTVFPRGTEAETYSMPITL